LGNLRAVSQLSWVMAVTAVCSFPIAGRSRWRHRLSAAHMNKKPMYLECTRRAMPASGPCRCLLMRSKTGTGIQVWVLLSFKSRPIGTAYSVGVRLESVFARACAAGKYCGRLEYAWAFAPTFNLADVSIRPRMLMSKPEATVRLESRLQCSFHHTHVMRKLELRLKCTMRRRITNGTQLAAYDAAKHVRDVAQCDATRATSHQRTAEKPAPLSRTGRPRSAGCELGGMRRRRAKDPAISSGSHLDGCVPTAAPFTVAKRDGGGGRRQECEPRDIAGRDCGVQDDRSLDAGGR